MLNILIHIILKIYQLWRHRNGDWLPWTWKYISQYTEGPYNTNITWFSLSALDWTPMNVKSSQVTGCLFNCMFSKQHCKHQSSKLLALCEGNPSLTSRFPSWKARNTERVSLLGHHHGIKNLRGYKMFLYPAASSQVSHSHTFFKLSQADVCALSP